jgi:hypothetical protein
MTKTLHLTLCLSALLALSGCAIETVKIKRDAGQDASLDATANNGSDGAANGSDTDANGSGKDGGGSTGDGGHSTGDGGGKDGGSSAGDGGTACAAPCTNADSSFCDTSKGQCAVCKVDEHCKDILGKPACQADVGCFECSADNKSACGGKKPYCKAGGNECVECNTAGDCKDAQKPACVSNVCTPCTGDGDCLGNAVCDESDGPFKGQCVQCTPNPADETAKCGDKSCNPFTRTCTDRKRDDADICQPCLADSECKADHRCIPMDYDGAPHKPFEDAVGGGGYCLEIAPGCTRPYGASPINRASISGASATNYCGVNETKTTCEAIRAFGDACEGESGPDAALCGAEGARCETVNSIANTCTYSCDDQLECGNNRNCIGSDKYCGGSN